MCGIAGFAGMRDARLLRRMAAIQAHRGPDGDGFYSDESVSLAHRRLSIIGGESGRQPLTNEDGSVVLVCNGEIYNYRELRDALRRSGHTFATESDNEVIVHLYEAEGLHCLRRLDGMFAFVLWDRARRRLVLARDRFGIKPLCYSLRHGVLIFASEAKAIFLWEGVPRQVNMTALDALLTYKFVPGDETLFDGVQRVPPGAAVVFDVATGSLDTRTYWRVQLATRANGRPPDERECTRHLARLLDEAVRSHMVSDVPIGATLSGGLDSSLVVALMSRHSERPVKTFSIGFGDPTDEVHFARIVAEHFRTDHTELIQDRREFLAALPRVLWHVEEPIAGALLPTYFLGRMVHEAVKVVLVGEGSDEVFGGYVRFKTLVPPFSLLPRRVSHWAYVRGLNALTGHERGRLYTPEFSAVVRAGRTARPADGLEAWLGAPGHDVVNKVLAFEQRAELPNYQLPRVDRLTMAFGVEARVPFLDHRLVEYVNGLPSSLKIRRFSEKHILKRAAEGILPERILRRSKQAMSSPISSWFGAGLKEVASDYLSEERLRRRGYFRSPYVRNLVEAGGRKRWLSAPEFKVNALMMIELWHQLFIDPPSWPPEASWAGDEAREPENGA